MRNLKVHLDGILIRGCGIKRAENIYLRRHNNATVLISAWNGKELFIKENGKVRESTQSEWRAYWEHIDQYGSTRGFDFREYAKK
ncbi:MAG: hypothetical protein ACTSQ8_23690 [Candidatus Helarchaeota archaeon]